MRIGVLTAALLDRPLVDALDVITGCGVTCVELPVGGFFPNHHCSAVKLLSNRGALTGLTSELLSRGVTVSALAVHGNPLHPRAEIRENHRKDVISAIRIAGELGSERITLLCGLPGGGPQDETPNWITQGFPPELVSALVWQWDTIALPYWAEVVKEAAAHEVTLCFEMVPADLVYNPAALARFCDELGPYAGANFDPSHLWFQGIDPIEAVRYLGARIKHVHLKDALLRADSVNGLLDPRPMNDVGNRSWAYRTIGTGHDETFWRRLATEIRLAGYDDVVSIEHEDSALSPEEGLRSAIDVARRCVPTQPADSSWFGHF